jgi:hypothetical protein
METGTTFFSLLAALYPLAGRIPGGGAPFRVVVACTVVATIVTAVTPKGDYARAMRALRAG